MLCQARQNQVPSFESLVWLDQRLNPGLPDHGRTLYSLSGRPEFNPWSSYTKDSKNGTWCCHTFSFQCTIKTIQVTFLLSFSYLKKQQHILFCNLQTHPKYVSVLIWTHAHLYTHVQLTTIHTCTATRTYIHTHMHSSPSICANIELSLYTLTPTLTSVIITTL